MKTQRTPCPEESSRGEQSKKTPPEVAEKSEIFGHPENLLQAEWNCSAMHSCLELSAPTLFTSPSLHFRFRMVPFFSPPSALFASLPHVLPFHFSYSKKWSVLKCHFPYENCSPTQQKTNPMFLKQNYLCKQNANKQLCHNSNYKPKEVKILFILDSLCACTHVRTILHSQS